MTGSSGIAGPYAGTDFVKYISRLKVDNAILYGTISKHTGFLISELSKFFHGLTLPADVDEVRDIVGVISIDDRQVDHAVLLYNKVLDSDLFKNVILGRDDE